MVHTYIFWYNNNVQYLCHLGLAGSSSCHKVISVHALANPLCIISQQSFRVSYCCVHVIAVTSTIIQQHKPNFSSARLVGSSLTKPLILKPTSAWWSAKMDGTEPLAEESQLSSRQSPGVKRTSSPSFTTPMSKKDNFALGATPATDSISNSSHKHVQTHTHIHTHTHTHHQQGRSASGYGQSQVKRRALI